MTTRNGISRRESLKLMFGMLFTPLLKIFPNTRENKPSGELIVGPSPAAMKAMEWPEDWQTKGIVDRHELLNPVHKDVPLSWNNWYFEGERAVNFEGIYWKAIDPKYPNQVLEWIEYEGSSLTSPLSRLEQICNEGGKIVLHHPPKPFFLIGDENES